MVEYWIWLQQVLGYGSNALPAILSEFKSAKAFYDAPNSEKTKRVKLTRKQISKLNNIPRKTIFGIIDECKQSGITIITPESELYPNRLLGMPNPPAVLYAKGNLFNLDDELVITIVGPRKPTKFGVEKAYDFSRTLTRAGCVIASGGALGIDSAAHSGSIAENGRTVLVLAHGLNFKYLKANENLRNSILKDGMIISEFPPSFKASKTSFPIRNRILSAISCGVVLFEAPEISGALITANLAAEQGKDVFVMPGSPLDRHYEGSNKLLRDGAITLLEPLNILEEYLDMYPHKIDLHSAFNIPDDRTFEDFLNSYEIIADTPHIDVTEYEKPRKREFKSVKRLTKDVSQLSDTAQMIFRYSEKEFYPDEIVAEKDIDIKTVLSALVELEIYGYVEAIPGGRYKIVN